MFIFPSDFCLLEMSDCLVIQIDTIVRLVMQGRGVLRPLSLDEPPKRTTVVHSLFQLRLSSLSLDHTIQYQLIILFYLIYVKSDIKVQT